MPDKYIGFLQLAEGASDAYTAAMLVTDLKSIPVEFRVTLPIKPTPIQKSLYGETLVAYIGAELCGQQLLNAITHELELTFVTPDYMLSIRPNSVAPVLCVQKVREPVAGPASNHGDASQDDHKRWELSSGSFQPVTFVTATGFDEDFNGVRPLLEELSARFDLLEPFERINRALEVLAEQDDRFKK